MEEGADKKERASTNWGKTMKLELGFFFFFYFPQLLINKDFRGVFLLSLGLKEEDEGVMVFSSCL